MKAIYTLVGMQHRGTMALVRSLPHGKPLTLVRDPENKFDPNAVKVMLNAEHIGFVKATEAGALARYMTAAGMSEMPATLNATSAWPQVETTENNLEKQP